MLYFFFNDTATTEIYTTDTLFPYTTLFRSDMLAGGARPAWMGYLEVADVDAAVAAIEADGGAVHMPATDLPVGRIAMVSDPQGAVFYVMDPIPPEGMEGMESDVFSVKIGRAPV